VRLKGRALLRGLLSFHAICTIGAVGIASRLFDRQGTSWWLSGRAGIVVGSVRNYAMASVFTWRRTRSHPPEVGMAQTVSRAACDAASRGKGF